MKAYGLLTSVAVADALGYPLEFHKRLTTEDLMRVVLSPQGLTCSDDTQMSLFLCEALDDWHSCRIQDFRVAATSAYLRWYHTQTKGHLGFEGRLLGFEELYSQEAPGNTCMNSLRLLSRGRVDENDSKGNGALMRCAPIALYVHQHHGGDEDLVELVAGIDATITHHHQYAAMSSQYFCVLLTKVLAGTHLMQAIKDTNERMLGKCDGVRPILELVFATSHTTKYRDMRRQLGGWVAEEALALAIGAVANSRSYLEAVSSSATIDGDSDTVAAIAGALCACIGWLPDEDLVERLNLIKPISYASKLSVWTE